MIETERNKNILQKNGCGVEHKIVKKQFHTGGNPTEIRKFKARLQWRKNPKISTILSKAERPRTDLRGYPSKNI